MKKLNFLILMAIMLSLFSCVVYGATSPTCSITTPASNTAYNGTVNFEVAISSNGTGGGNITGVNVTVSSSVVGSNVTSGTIGDGSNVNLTSYTVDVDTSTITDVKQTTVTANIIMNDSSYLGSCTSTLVDFDNTDPVCSCTIEREIITKGKSIDYDCSASTDTTDRTYSCVQTYNDGTTETVTTEVGVFENTVNIGEASMVCTVTDEVSKTNACSAITTTIKSDSDDAVIEETIKQKRKSNAIYVVIGIILSLALVGVLAAVIAKKKKGKKK